MAGKISRREEGLGSIVPIFSFWNLDFINFFALVNKDEMLTNVELAYRLMQVCARINFSIKILCQFSENCERIGAYMGFSKIKLFNKNLDHLFKFYRTKLVT